jgi:hypothetical protein
MIEGITITHTVTRATSRKESAMRMTHALRTAFLITLVASCGGSAAPSNGSGGSSGGTAGTSGTAGSGSSGTAGTSGSAGTTGVSTAGTSGTAGDTGTAGTTAGTAGDTGTAGTAGTTGSAGTTATAGTTGTAGHNGTAGAGGSSAAGTAGQSGGAGHAGNGGGTAGTTGAAGGVGANGSSVSGAPTDMAYSSIGSVFWAGMPDVAGSTVVYIFSKTLNCTDISKAGWDTTIPKGTQILEMKMMGNTPKAYTPVIGAGNFPSTGQAQVNYALATGGAPVETFASAGSVTLSTIVASTKVTGSFNLMFGANAVTGTYSATYCNVGREP